MTGWSATSRARPRRRAALAAAAVAAACLLVLGGCGLGVEGADKTASRGREQNAPGRTDVAAPQGSRRGERAPATPGATTHTVPTPPARGRVDTSFADAVARLRVAPERPAGYDRDLFVHWSDTDGDGCDTRDEVLLGETLRPRRTRAVAPGCDVVGGPWLSPYDGRRTRDASTLDIDHLVPLAQAWSSGARRWSAARRESFANDQGDPRSLVATSASSNRSKGDRDPAGWLPERGVCDYTRAWVAVKLRWRLSVDAVERGLLRRAARECAGRVAVRVVGAAAAPATDDGVLAGVLSAPSAPSRPSSPGGSDPRLDPRFDTCGAAADAGYGDYVRGRDAEYDWYTDGDSDGRVCET